LKVGGKERGRHSGFKKKGGNFRGTVIGGEKKKRFENYPGVGRRALGGWGGVRKKKESPL